MEKSILVINRMQEEGMFEKYAIGGGIAALFYIEPFATFDLDIFITLPVQQGVLVNLTPIYNWLERKGYKPEQEQVNIEGIPVQFIPAYNDLIYESILHSVEKLYGATTTFVLRPEYLMAIMIQTMRSNDKIRLQKMLTQAEINFKLLDSILSKFNLSQSFESFKKQYHE
ncbi:MAG: hypothetical protein HYZ34_08515 [Ignavibacteriae bacterium]|nr:hypothetical protein [Ignavibacteriota bacterium]